MLNKIEYFFNNETVALVCGIGSILLLVMSLKYFSDRAVLEKEDDADVVRNTKVPVSNSAIDVGTGAIDGTESVLTEIIKFFSSGPGLILGISVLLLVGFFAVGVVGTGQRVEVKPLTNVVSRPVVDDTLHVVDEFIYDPVTVTADNYPLGYRPPAGVIMQYGGGIIECGGGTSDNRGAFVDGGEQLYREFFSHVDVDMMQRANNTISDVRVVAYTRSHPEFYDEIRGALGYTAGVCPTHNDVCMYMAYQLSKGVDLFGLGQPYVPPIAPPVFDLYNPDSGFTNVD